MTKQRFTKKSVAGLGSTT